MRQINTRSVSDQAHKNKTRDQKVRCLIRVIVKIRFTGNIGWGAVPSKIGSLGSSSNTVKILIFNLYYKIIHSKSRYQLILNAVVYKKKYAITTPLDINLSLKCLGSFIIAGPNVIMWSFLLILIRRSYFCRQRHFYWCSSKFIIFWLSVCPFCTDCYHVRAQFFLNYKL